MEVGKELQNYCTDINIVQDSPVEEVSEIEPAAAEIINRAKASGVKARYGITTCSSPTGIFNDTPESGP